MMAIAIPLMFGFIQQSDAQKHLSGLYLTYQDYLDHKLSYPTDPAKPAGTKVLIHEFIGMKNVTVITDGQKKLIPKSGLFGYHDSDNNDYRFCDNKAYQIIDTTGFFIYSYDRLIQQGKGPKPTRVYYFSKKNNDTVLPLTAENIEMAFPKNPKFRYLVEVAAKTDNRLDTYDKESNAYKIKELYVESLK